MRSIRVLIVDDSIVFREAISRGISTAPNIEVVGKAVDPYDARDKLLELNPDVMICDVQMPKLNGVEFIKRLLPQYKIPIIVVSSISDVVFDAMDAGAVDFLSKPDARTPNGFEIFINELIIKIRGAVNVNLSANLWQVPKSGSNRGMEKSVNVRNKVIAIGASTGGTEAIYNLLKNLPKDIPGIIIVQHIPPVFSKMFADRLNLQTHFTVKEAQTGDTIEPGKVLIAPGDQHMKLKKAADKYIVETIQGNKVNGHCPSVDVLFESVAKVASKNAIGVILTGMGHDGAVGLMSMRRAGARTIGQDQKSSVVYGMPKVAFEIGAVEKQVAISNIPSVICDMLK
ncbi:protein-glutamate methylesterase/protein-glutamine glutaminase [Clostridium beijerinckii]|jgi:Chemotaxis response regulator containing a CheY-like receiver domain and a methylesterase domain|uniref:Protein-glutamate methylesterase/protein-glutamine glutaminase n=2 Tax=Clostridium beijerinckii TaxID=1520 RepID=A0AAE2UXE5_CLOBE|nr:chemotaxis response regulator protein-glutamate methylesterase [Clostridium beijerinckii]ABR36933.1 response regulator receiver modulated CheB methylesterase [Clostridium beijerinckii NCIMB 8052]AIU02028.1 response regulator receiver modulated CheB methylesterase [Clostridium beijerinckii ATCC 35702]MBF7808420.1 chemotaxis response regulator protein-glutamate methylesterase [Clostridium beijerinckii]NRT21989.1 two-component system chemotaxis response regulator CheB [Clostridium beijerinckii]